MIPGQPESQGYGDELGPDPYGNEYGDYGQEQFQPEIEYVDQSYGQEQYQDYGYEQQPPIYQQPQQLAPMVLPTQIVQQPYLVQPVPMQQPVVQSAPYPAVSFQNTPQGQMEASLEGNTEWVAVPSHIPEYLERQADKQESQQKKLDRATKELEEKLAVIETKHKSNFTSGNLALSTNAIGHQGPAGDEDFLRNRLLLEKRSLDQKYKNGIDEVNVRTLIEQQKLEALQKEIKLEEEKLNVQHLQEEQAHERRLLQKLRAEKRSFLLRNHTQEISHIESLYKKELNLSEQRNKEEEKVEMPANGGNRTSHGFQKGTAASPTTSKVEEQLHEQKRQNELLQAKLKQMEERQKVVVAQPVNNPLPAEQRLPPLQRAGSRLATPAVDGQGGSQPASNKVSGAQSDAGGRQPRDVYQSEDGGQRKPVELYPPGRKLGKMRGPQTGFRGNAPKFDEQYKLQKVKRAQARYKAELERLLRGGNPEPRSPPRVSGGLWRTNLPRSKTQATIQTVGKESQPQLEFQKRVPNNDAVAPLIDPLDPDVKLVRNTQLPPLDGSATEKPPAKLYPPASSFNPAGRQSVIINKDQKVDSWSRDELGATPNMHKERKRGSVPRNVDVLKPINLEIEVESDTEIIVDGGENGPVNLNGRSHQNNGGGHQGPYEILEYYDEYGDEEVPYYGQAQQVPIQYNYQGQQFPQQIPPQYQQPQQQQALPAPQGQGYAPQPLKQPVQQTAYQQPQAERAPDQEEREDPGSFLGGGEYKTRKKGGRDRSRRRR